MARHHFYGQLYVDDIADLAQYVADHAGGAGSSNITLLDEPTGYLQLHRIDPDNGLTFITGAGSLWVAEHQPATAFQVSAVTSDGFTITAVRPDDIDPSRTFGIQVIWIGDQQPETAVNDNAQTITLGAGDTHVVTGLPSGQIYSVIGLAYDYDPALFDIRYNAGSQFLRLTGDTAPITGVRWYTPLYSGTDWRIAASKGDTGPRGPKPWRFAGVWNSTTTYNGGTAGRIQDVVLYNNALYIMSENVADRIGDAPDSVNGSTDWQLFLPQGPKGDQGIQGVQGNPGPTGASGLTFRGPWSNSTAYAANDLVTWGGSGYVTAVAKPAGSPPPTGTAADPGTDDTAVNSGWTLLVMQGAQGIQGVAGTNGTNGTNGANGAPGQGFNYRGAWAANTAYAPYDVVTYAGSTYLATTSFTSASTFNPSNWSLWAAKGDPGAAASAAASPVYGATLDTTTGHLILEVVQPDSGEVFAAYKYDESFVGLGSLTFSWSTTNPSHLLMGIS